MNFYEKCEFSQELTEFTKAQSEKFTQFCEFTNRRGVIKSKKFTRFCNFANRKKIQAFHKNADERIEI